MYKALSDSILFSGLEPEQLALIEKAGRHISADRGQILFFQGDPAERFFVVLSGKAKIYKIGPDGEEQILLLANPGDSFGEAALFAAGPYPANGEIVEDAELLAFSRDLFMRLITDNPTLAVNMIARLSMLLHHLTRVIQRISLEDVTTRLAGYLIGQMPEGESVIHLHEKKMILAAILGTIPETLSRSFAKLTKLNAIDVDGQKIKILDREMLTQIASGHKN